MLFPFFGAQYPHTREFVLAADFSHHRGSLSTCGAIIWLGAAMLLSATCGSSSQTQTSPSPSPVRCGVRIEVQSAAFPPSGGTGAVSIATGRDCEWTATAEAGWITLTPRAGQGDASVAFTVASNADPASRSTSIVVNDQRLEIAQQGSPCRFTLSSNRESVNSSGGDRTVEVRASAAQCAWTASAGVPWITIASGRDGRGDGTVRFHVDAGTGPPRTGTLTIAGQTVHVDQGTGCSYSIGTETFTVDRAGGDRQVAVSVGSGCAWTAESNAVWITITSGSTGTGPGVVVFRVAATDGLQRTGTLRVAGRIVTIVQSAGCTYAVSPAAQQVSSSGAAAAASVATAAGCAWTATSSVNWITMSTMSGSGPGQATFAVAPNLSPARTGTLTIAGQNHTVTQPSQCTWSFTPPSHELPFSGGFGTVLVFVTGACTWAATSSVEWIRVMAGASGVGGGIVQFTVTANSGRARTGVISIGGEKYVVTQAAGE